MATKSSRWKHYLPALFAVVLAWVFLTAPELAAFFLVAMLLIFAAFYAFIVRKMHKAVDAMRWRDGSTVDSTATGNEPSFRNVTFQIFRDGNVWFREIVD